MCRSSLLRAEAGWTGDFDVRAAAAGWAVNASGDARLTDVRVHTRADGRRRRAAATSC